MTGTRVRLAVTLGDPRGIGPEVSACAAQALSDAPDAPYLTFVGPAGTGAEHAADTFEPVGDWTGDASDTALAGRLAVLAVERAVALVRSDVVDGIVTSPVDKRALRAAGCDHPGHTELLAALAGSPAVCMFMVAEQTRVGGALRVALATTHIPLASVPRAVTYDRIVEQTRLVASGLRRGWGLETPRLALCALNPHASDGGLFGDEEARILIPAAQALRREGLSVSDPLPADTVFSRALDGAFDAVIAPYHDVGMAAFKTTAFGQGVNVTLGLPFVRTSPDHGTALDIAGRGLADAGSMAEALRLATRLALRWRMEPTASP